MSQLLQLEDYFITKLNMEYQMSDESDTDISKQKLDFQYNIYTNNEDNQLRLLKLGVSLSEMSEGVKVGYQLSCDICGRFRISHGYPCDEDKREFLFRVNGLSVLYSTLRGVLGNVSGSFPDRRLNLPTIDPADVVKSIESENENKNGA